MTSCAVTFSASLRVSSLSLPFLRLYALGDEAVAKQRHSGLLGLGFFCHVLSCFLPSAAWLIEDCGDGRRTILSALLA
jgi:hypothetical protein